MSLTLQHIEKYPFFDVIEQIAGEEACEIVKSLLFEDKTIKEIAKDTGLKINLIRKVLYKLNKYYIATYEKSEKKINPIFREFTWRFNPQAVVKYVEKRKEVLIDNLKKNLNYLSQKQVFFCGNQGCSTYDFEKAFELNFKCPNCNTALKLLDSTTTINKIKTFLSKVYTNY